MTNMEFGEFTQSECELVLMENCSSKTLLGLTLLEDEQLSYTEHDDILFLFCMN